jgi:hypothetical protein
MSPINEGDKLIREYSDSNKWGAWIGKWEFETPEGETYTLCQDQDGGEWMEEG